MSRMNLRELARQHAEGTLDQSAYRQARADLLEAIMDDDPTDPSATDPNTDFATHRAIAQRTESAAAAARKVRRNQVAYRIIAAAGGIALLVLLIWLFAR